MKDPTERMNRRIWHWTEGSQIQAIFAITRKEMRSASDPKKLLALAGISAETGYYTQAFELVDRALAIDPGIIRKTRYLGLTAALAIDRPDIKLAYRSEIAGAEKLKRANGSFERLILEHRDSIAVVGNAPCELGKGAGKQIDAREIVIRFNNFSSDFRFASDYGAKTDIWVRNGRYRHIWRRSGPVAPLHIIADNLYWRKRNGQDILLDAALGGDAIVEYPHRIFSELMTELGAKPSSGILMLAWIERTLGSLEGVLVRGFNLGDQQIKLSHYYADPRFTPVPHNWAAEQIMFDRLIRRLKD